MLDCIIVGAGPAGISAALTLQANGKEFALLGTRELSEKIYKAEEIRNYPGLFRTTGKDFQTALQTQLVQEEIPILEEKVTGVYALKDKFAVMTQNGNALESKCVILACGVQSIKEIDGEHEFVGRGVSYCATCDGFLYKGKKIAVICTTKTLEHEVEYLANIAQTVYLIPLYKKVEVSGDNIVKIIKMPKKIIGAMRVNGVQFDKNPTPELPATLPVDGVFMLRDCLSPAVLVGGLTMENGHVVVQRDTSTNLSGCFAAGDCTGRPYQYAKAIGEGNVAAHAVVEYCKNNP